MVTHRSNTCRTFFLMSNTFISRIGYQSCDTANRRLLLLTSFSLDVRSCLRFFSSNAHTKRFSRWSATSCNRRFRAIPVCAAMSSKPLSSWSKWPLMLAIMSRSRPSRLRVSSVSFLLSRKVVRPMIASTVNPSKLLCINGNVISKEYLNISLALSSHRHLVSFSVSKRDPKRI